MLSALKLWMIRIFWDIKIQGFYSYKTEGFIRDFIILFEGSGIGRCI